MKGAVLLTEMLELGRDAPMSEFKDVDDGVLRVVQQVAWIRYVSRTRTEEDSDGKRY